MKECGNQLHQETGWMIMQDIGRGEKLGNEIANVRFGPKARHRTPM
jgi:hypothetical protein